ncbi:hypothetical protein K1719_008951 [Acacia pycnantha]|nr:hypothetical protein K1719_008951 [Acacia pycnantha]
MEAVKSLTQQRSDLFQELEAEKKAHLKAADTVRAAAKDCFNMALAQIQHLNPGVELNLTGYDYRSYIRGDVLVPPPPSPEDESVSLADDDQGEQVDEETSSAIQPGAYGAPVEEAAPPS